MPAPDRMLNILRRAIEHTKATAGRVGYFVNLQNCTEILVAGDMHGDIGNFQTVMKAADLAQHPTRHLVLQELIHSSYRYPNGGDKSHQLVDLFAALKCQFPQQVHYLPGNHELAQFTGRPIGKGEDRFNELYVRGIQHAYGEAATEINATHNELFAALPIALRTSNGIFVSHSIIAERYLPTFRFLQLQQSQYAESDFQPGGVVYSLVWGRDTSQEAADEFLRRVESDFVITGHIPTDDGYLLPNTKQVIVDCSASPSAYILVPADVPITVEQLRAGIVTF